MNMSWRGLFFNLLVGLPGGFLIIMGTFMFNSLLGMLFPTGPIVMLALLSVAALVVGLLARLMQPFHGLLTALVAGIIAAFPRRLRRLPPYRRLSNIELCCCFSRYCNGRKRAGPFRHGN